MKLSPEELKKEQDAFLQRMARLKMSPEDRAKRFANSRPFDYEVWLRQIGPAKPEELAEMEEMLRERDEERKRFRAFEEGLEKSSR